MYYGLMRYRSRQVVAKGTKGMGWDKEKYMHGIVCLAKLTV